MVNCERCMFFELRSTNDYGECKDPSKVIRKGAAGTGLGRPWVSSAWTCDNATSAGTDPAVVKNANDARNAKRRAARALAKANR